MMTTLGRLGWGTLAISTALAVGVGCDRGEADQAQACPSTEIAAPVAASDDAEPRREPTDEPKADAAAPTDHDARSAERAEQSAEQLRVKRLVVTRGVEQREPVDSATSFTKDDERIYAFVEMQNPAKAPSTVVVSFEPPDGGSPTGNVELEIGPSPRWRTWAFTRGAQTEGEWTAVVSTQDGKVLARESFEVTL